MRFKEFGTSLILVRRKDWFYFDISFEVVMFEINYRIGRKVFLMF